MIHTYIFKNLILPVGLLLLTSACYDQKDPLEDIIDRTGNHYPVVANIRDLEAQGYPHDPSVGGVINLELQYWSLDPIDRINFYDIISGDTSQIASYDYQPAFSKRSETDTLVVSYTVPGVTVGTNIELLLEVINENSLSDYGTYDFDVE